MKSYRKYLQAFCNVMLTINLIGCSAIQGVLVDNLDFFVKREVNAAFDLNSEQQKKWDSKWKKNISQLAKAGFFKSIANDMGEFSNKWRKGKLTYSSLERLIAKIRNIWAYPGGEFLRQQTAFLVMDLNEENFEAFTAYMSEKTEERFQARKLKPEKFSEARVEKAIEAFEEWYGEPTSTQSAKLSSWVLTPIEQYKQRYLQRVQAEKSIVAHLMSFTTPKEIENALNYWLKSPASLRTGQLKQVYLDYQADWKNRIVRIDRMVSMQQRQNALEKLDEAISLLNEIDKRWR